MVYDFDGYDYDYGEDCFDDEIDNEDDDDSWTEEEMDAVEAERAEGPVPHHPDVADDPWAVGAPDIEQPF